MKISRRRMILLSFAGGLALLAPPGGYIAWDQAHHNFGRVRPGVYRSGQMPAEALGRVLEAHAIRSVLNLRGPNEAAWYKAEQRTTLAAGATQIDVPMSSCLWMTREQFRSLVDLIATAERPLLVHCSWGSERTGLACAISELLRPGATIEDARRQFSLAYLYVPAGDGKVMSEHLDAYLAWLSQSGKTHSPEVFRGWVNEVYEPLGPNSDEWPYNPYPLVVITRPGEASIARLPAAHPQRVLR